MKLGDSLDDIHRECMKSPRYRWAHYRLLPYYTLVIWWIRLKFAIDRLLDLVDDEEENE